MKSLRALLAVSVLAWGVSYGQVTPNSGCGPNGCSGGGGGTGTVTQVNTGTGLSGGPITTTGTVSLSTPVSVANGGTGTTTSTGTGSTVLSNSPSLISPALGTPSSINLGNATNLPYSALPSQASATILGNASGSSGPPSALNPLAVANMLSAVIAADVISTGPITLSGIQTVDGVSIGGGQIVFVDGQATQSQNGLYVSAGGAWTRAANFPAGFVIAANCDLIIMIRNGAVNGGHYFQVNTTTAITIGTSNLVASDAAPLGSSSKSGLVKTTDINTQPAASMVLSPTAAGGALFDCVSYQTLGGSVGDGGNTVGILSGCAGEEHTSGHLLLTTNGGKPSSSVGTVSNGSTDHKFTVTGLSGATTVTITFHDGFSVQGGPLVCHAQGSSAIVSPTVTLTGTGPWTAVTFGMTAFTGTLYGLCF